MATYKLRHCRRLSIHADHRYQLDQHIPGLSQVTSAVTYMCPGVAHNHELYCCTEHNHHVMPHVGCVLR